jgi:hypothetical protein
MFGSKTRRNAFKREQRHFAVEGGESALKSYATSHLIIRAVAGRVGQSVVSLLRDLKRHGMIVPVVTVGERGAVILGRGREVWPETRAQAAVL